MIKYIYTTVALLILLTSYNVTAQVRVTGNGNVSPGGISSYFLDASSASALNNTNNLGKGLLFPRTDLTTFEGFIPAFTNVVNVPNRFDGMIVYNVGTGNTLPGASNTIVSVTPGFYYYDNKSFQVKGGIWKRIMDGDSVSGPAGTDDQIVSDFSVQGNTLSITLEDGNTATVSLTDIATVVNTDNQTVTDFSINGSGLSVTLENGNTTTVSLADLKAQIDTNTTNASLTEDGTNLILTDSDGGTVSILLSDIASAVGDKNTTNASLTQDGTNLILI